MNKISMWCLAGLFFLTSAAFSQDKMSGGTEKAIVGLEQQWLESQKTNNPAVLDTLLADKFVNTDNEGKATDKKESIAQAKATKWSSVEYKDLKVVVLGNTAIATGIFKAKGTDDKGKPLDLNDRFTDTWAKTSSGKWQCLASQQTSIKM